jgi:rhamnosyltransferase
MVFITQDALPLKDDWLINILKPFENNDKIAVVYGKQKAWKYENHAEKFYYEYSFPDVAITITYDGKEKAKQNRKNNAFISNVNAAYKKEIWSRYKFSEIVDCSEDKDFAKRVLFGGYLVYYEPSAVVYHSHTFSLIQVIKKYRHFGLSLGMGVADIPQKRSSLVLKLFDYFLNEIKYLINQEKIYYIPYALMYDSCKILGTGIGKIELKIKNILKR